MMLRKWIIAAVAVALIGPAWLAAQQPPRPPRSPRPPRAPGEPRAWAFSYSENRGRIGVVVRTDASPETDKLGAKLEAVTPGGPAEKAGLKAGDIITKFNGTGLAGVKSEGEDESGPGQKLIELARKLAPGDTVQIEYRRGGDTKTATLVAEDIDMAWSFVAPHIAPTPMPHLDGPEMMMQPRAFGFCFGDSWCDLDLVTLNADLGEYFGTKEGILVVKAPADSSLPLRAGDVILSIAGRKPTSPAHAMRILRSYEAGETVSIELMRKQKRVTVAWKVPEPEARHMRRPRGREEQSHYRRVVRTRLGTRWV